MLQCGTCSKHINELFIFCYVKIQWSLIALNGFCNIMHWSSGKQWFTVLGRSSKYWQYVIKTQYKKITSFNNTIDLQHKNLYVMRSCHAHGGRYKKVFQNFKNFQLKAWILLFTTNNVCYFPWNDRLTFSRKYLPNAHI